MGKLMGKSFTPPRNGTFRFSAKIVDHREGEAPAEPF
jgi:hypothetical protein